MKKKSETKISHSKNVDKYFVLKKWKCHEFGPNFSKNIFFTNFQCANVCRHFFRNQIECDSNEDMSWITKWEQTYVVAGLSSAFTPFLFSLFELLFWPFCCCCSISYVFCQNWKIYNLNNDSSFVWRWKICFFFKCKIYKMNLREGPFLKKKLGFQLKSRNTKCTKRIWVLM